MIRIDKIKIQRLVAVKALLFPFLTFRVLAGTSSGSNFAMSQRPKLISSGRVVELPGLCSWHHD